MKSVSLVSILTSVSICFLLMGCSSPSPLSEEELLQRLAEMEQHGPFQFQERTWPRLENKTITYCGTISAAQSTEAGSSVTLNLEETYEEEPLGWSLEGRSDSPELTREYGVGDAICITGIFESYVVVQHYAPPYRGSVRLETWEKPATS